MAQCLFEAVFLCFITFSAWTNANDFTYKIELNELVEDNLAYFQSAFSPNKKLDGKLLVKEAHAYNATFVNVSLSKIENFGTVNSFQFYQTIDLMTMVNNVSGALTTPSLLLNIAKIDSPAYFGGLSPFLNVQVELASTQFDIYLVMSPSTDSKGCTLKLTIDLSIGEAILFSDIPFANGRNITDFFVNTIIAYANENFSTQTLEFNDSDCDPTTTFMALAASIKSITRQSLDDFFTFHKHIK